MVDAGGWPEAMALPAAPGLVLLLLPLLLLPLLLLLLLILRAIGGLVLVAGAAWGLHVEGSPLCSRPADDCKKMHKKN